MKKNLDITKPRYSEQFLPVHPLAIRYFEVPPVVKLLRDCLN